MDKPDPVRLPEDDEDVKDNTPLVIKVAENTADIRMLNKWQETQNGTMNRIYDELIQLRQERVREMDDLREQHNERIEGVQSALLSLQRTMITMAIGFITAMTVSLVSSAVAFWLT